MSGRSTPSLQSTLGSGPQSFTLGKVGRVTSVATDPELSLDETMKPSNRIIRDTAYTEMLDYFSAFLTVLTSLMVCVIRFLGPEDNKVGNSIDRELT